MRLVSQVFSLQTINNLIVIGNALVSVQVGSKLTRYPQRNGCRPLHLSFPPGSQCFSVTTIYWIAHRPEGRDFHMGTCVLYLFVTQYILLRGSPLGAWPFVSVFHKVILSCSNLNQGVNAKKKSTSLMCRFLISFHWVGLVINVCGPFSWNARVLFNFTLSPSLKRSLKLALNNSGNQGLSIKTKLFFLLSFLLGGSSHLYFNW